MPILSFWFKFQIKILSNTIHSSIYGMVCFIGQWNVTSLYTQDTAYVPTHNNHFAYAANPIVHTSFLQIQVPISFWFRKQQVILVYSLIIRLQRPQMHKARNLLSVAESYRRNSN